MNKKQFIKKGIEENKKAYGRWHSTSKVNSADPLKLLTDPPPQNEEEAVMHGNALANTGNYPIGTSECFNVGISGGCGTKCFVYLKGECDVPEEMTSLDSDELKLHEALYGTRNSLR